MRTTQGQAAFGQNVQTIITYSNTVKSFSNRYRWTRFFNARRTLLLENSNTHQKISMNYFDFHIISAKLSRSAK
jgi:hypothetical protein